MAKQQTTKEESRLSVVGFVGFKNRIKLGCNGHSRIPAHVRKKQQSYHQFRVSLVYIVTPNLARATVARRYLTILNK